MSDTPAHDPMKGPPPRTGPAPDFMTEPPKPPERAASPPPQPVNRKHMREDLGGPPPKSPPSPKAPAAEPKAPPPAGSKTAARPAPKPSPPPEAAKARPERLVLISADMVDPATGLPQGRLENEFTRALASRWPRFWHHVHAVWIVAVDDPLVEVIRFAHDKLGKRNLLVTLLAEVGRPLEAKGWFPPEAQKWLVDNAPEAP